MSTVAPRKRGNSYRDPTLSDRWLAQAAHRANTDKSNRFEHVDSRKIILRLVHELNQLNKETNR